MIQADVDINSPMMVVLMIAFVVGSILFICTAEFVRRRVGGSDSGQKPSKSRQNRP
jgi:hypothetical protein